MLKIYHGTKLEKLADHLLEEWGNRSDDKLLAPEIFVVQNHAIGQWLSLYMAGKTGITANLKFEFPSERIWKLIRAIDPDIPRTLPSDRGPMTWSLMALLQDEQVLAEFANLDHYVQDDDPTQRAVRTWKLSDKIADVFDQYLIYRPQMVLGWEGDVQYQTETEAERWQARLWNRLITHWQNGDDAPPHRARLMQQLLEHLKEGKLDKDELPSRITVFGISSMPPPFIEVMALLSELTEVHFYHLTVDSEVTDAATFDNPLLQSLATQSTDFMALFSRFAEEVEKVSVDSAVSGKGSVFHRVQADIKEDRLPGEDSNHLTAAPSIQVHSCHSPKREVEVLYDQLLALLDENPELNPDDILIMTPEIDMYAPMIEAVFETPDEGQPDIPHSIADQSVKRANPAIQAFLQVLELCESRFKVTDVLDLLDARPIREKFEFSDEDLNRLEMWIRDNRIRWAVDGEFKRNVGVPESDSFTWKSGLNRVLLGYAMKGNDDQLYDNIFPYDEIETSDDAQLAGKFAHFMRALFQLGESMLIKRNTNDWSKQLKQIIDIFLPDNRDYFREVSQIRDALEKFKNFSSLGHYEGNVPYRVVRSWLEHQLDEQTTGGGRIGRGVTFSSLMPMRSIPFEVIGIIGMDEGAFPRSEIPVAFNLMNLDPQPGDPIRSEEDRYLFVETMLSARSHLYFSYVGQSNRQDTEFPPSVVLKEFLDYLEDYYGLQPENLVQKHRLQAFSTTYFREDMFFSYSKTQYKISRQLQDGSTSSDAFLNTDLPEPDEEGKQLSLGNLISFFQHPAKYLLQNRLGIYLREDDVLTEDREPFELSGLDDYRVGQELLDRYIREKPLDSYQQILESRDMLPEGWSGKQAYRQKVQEVRDFGSEITAVLDQEPIADREVDVEIGSFRIVGKLGNIYENALVTYRFGSMRPKDLVDLWIRHLIFQLVKPSSHPGFSCLFTRDDKKPFAAYRLSPVDDPRSILSGLLDIYWQGLQRCTYFFPKAAFEYGYKVCFKGEHPEAGIKKASASWILDYSDYPGEGEDPYNKLVLGSKNPLKTERFREIATQFWRPFFNVLNREGG